MYVFFHAIKKVHLSTKLWVIDGFSMKGKRSKIQFPIFSKKKLHAQNFLPHGSENSWNQSYIYLHLFRIIKQRPAWCKGWCFRLWNSIPNFIFFPNEHYHKNVWPSMLYLESRVQLFINFWIFSNLIFYWFIWGPRNIY